MFLSEKVPQNIPNQRNIRTIIIACQQAITESSIKSAKIDKDEPNETKSALDEKEDEERDFKRNNDVNENAIVDIPSIVSTDTEQPNDESNIEELKKQINEIKLKLASRYGEISDDEDEDGRTPHQRKLSPAPNHDQNSNSKLEPADEDEELKNDYGETVLHLAIKEGNFRKVKAICEEDPRLASVKGCDDNTVLHYAASNEQLLCLQILSQFGNIDEVNSNSETILHAAARTGSTKCVRWICDNYPELVNVKGLGGNTPLHYATIYDKFSCLLILLRYSDIFVKNDDGHTAHDIANQKVDEDNETDNE